MADTIDTGPAGPQESSTGATTGPDAAPGAGGARDGLAGLRRATLWALGVAVLLFVYYVIADRTTPFSGDARVQAFVLRVAPEVTGHVARVGVVDNEVVEAGDELFAIDPEPFQIAVDQAQARLEQAGQAVGANTAAVDAAQAQLERARANAANVRAQTERVLELVRKGVYAQAREDDAVAAIDESEAAVSAAAADLRRAQEQLGPEGENNPAVQEALAALETARYNLARTAMTAPARGVVTNLQLAVGQTVTAGAASMTFISAEDIWLRAAMRENSLGVLSQGQSAEVVLDALPGQVFRATVRSVGWGVAGEAVDPATGLPQSTVAQGWLTDPQRFPVILSFEMEQLPRGARYSSRAAVIVYAGDNPVMDAIAWARIRLIALLTYVS
ncbi:HlyD family secretion protein [Albimonas pacifica]|uniref:Multidrug resistance efflux pump n=1 Tax=Albimonas pacifica TaxID=1114924 RepID=A0A1I3PN56_9RHOB|nr:HlyD family secretion protein [Albimonas pacifica]SFJ22456.1 Multidrug resistance efflux pump [Albimonas pacifica]